MVGIDILIDPRHLRLKYLHLTGFLGWLLHNVKLDRTSFKKQTFSEAAEHQATYNQMSAKDRGEIFQYLMRINFGFLGKDWPKMDKTVFSKRTRS